MDAIGFDRHDHQHCKTTAMKHADALCAERGLRLTPVRRHVLEILLMHHKAMGAYQILEELKQAGFGSQPPVVYRALDFLSENGLVHKIERLNAFIACAHPEGGHTPVFLICTDCNTVAEAGAELDQGRMADLAAQTGFAINRMMLEAEGRCQNCQSEAK